MSSILPIRLAATLSFAFSGLLSAQPFLSAQVTPGAPAVASTLPATPATATPPVPTPPLTPLQLPAHRADVTYTSGTLSVSASNSSLNQILRDISRQTGIKITGGVTDERVFGQYGPGAPAQILASLLDGTGSNMLLIHADASTPGELILTPRQGGPTPPNPNAPGFEDEPEYHNPSNVEAPQPAARPAAQPPSQTVPAATTPSGTGIPAASGTDQPTSPNGVKTPQQIYEQIMRMRQQQQQPPTTPQ
jgi:hypothetical protein